MWRLFALIAVACSLESTASAADLKRGLDAYQSNDYAAALVEWKPLADLGDPDAQYGLGTLYCFGQGVAKDLAQCAAWYRKAADQGNVKAQNNLGAMYENGDGVAKDPALAVFWYRKAAEQGFAIAQYCLGNAYAKGDGVAKDFVQANHWFRKAAEQGDVRAQSYLGLAYLLGDWGVAKDESQAFIWYLAAAQQGDLFSQKIVAEAYEEGRGVTKNLMQAVFWYSKAAAQGDAYGQFELGMHYLDGIGIEKSTVQAATWIRKAAEQGYVYAESTLSGMYFNGVGVEKDRELAMSWYVKAADQDFAKAQREDADMVGPRLDLVEHNNLDCTFLLYGAISQELSKNASQQLERDAPFCASVTVFLNSDGGDVDAAMSIGRKLRSMEATTKVAESHRCASACVLILAGGAFRFPAGDIVVHRAYYLQPEKKPEDAELRYQMISRKEKEYLEEMRMSSRLFDFMDSISPTSSATLTTEQLLEYRLSGADPVAEDRGISYRAAQLGISREQYIQEMQQADARCRNAVAYRDYAACRDESNSR